MAKKDEEISMEDFGSNAKGPLSTSDNHTYATFRELRDGDKNENAENKFTLSEAVEKIGIGKFQILLILMAGFVNMCDSVELMLLSVMAPTISCIWHLSSWQEAFITTIVFMGMAFGSSFWGWLSDRYGRKTMVIISASWLFYFGLISSFSPHYIWIIALRCLVGVGVGGIPLMYTLLIEFLPIHLRSYIILCLAFFWALGSAFLVASALLIMPTLGWRWLTGIATVPVLIFVILCGWLPKSPRFLLAAGEKDQAENVLKRMAEFNGTEFPQGSLQIETDLEEAKQGRFQDLFSDEYRITTLLLWLIFLCTGLLYFGVVLMTTAMFQDAGSGKGHCAEDGVSPPPSECGCRILTSKDYTDLLWTTFAEFPGVLLTMMGLERLGRKKTLAAEFFLCVVFLSLLLICSGRTFMLVLIFLVRGLSLGAFQGIFVYSPEVYPTIVRSLGFGACSTMSRIGAMATPYIAQVLLKVSIRFSVGVYIMISLMAFVSTLLLPLETKGRPMQEI